MPAIKETDYPYFEKKLYLPMIIKVLEKDLESIEKLPFKLNRNYLKIVEDALKLVRKDLKATEIHMLRHEMKVLKWESDAETTTYVFMSRGIEEHNKMLHTEIKTKCEELLCVYLAR